jgi:RND family efflux transporter MFP subunit
VVTSVIPGRTGSGNNGSSGSSGSSGGGFSGGTGGSGSSGSGGNAGANGTGGSGAGQGNSQNRVPTAADIAADQSQIDLMDTKLAIAQQDLRGASLTSPIDGTVAKVAIAKGDRVNASSTSQIVTIVGRSQYEVQVAVPLSEIDLIKPGEKASIVVDGISTALTGKVTLIGVLDNSSTSTPSYPVTVLLASTKTTLFDGAGASLSVDVGAVDNVLTVPSSAVHTTGSQHSVTVLDNGVTSEVPVGVGLVGSGLTQITSGLKAGQVVVLANVDEAMPTTQINNRFGGAGGLGGGANLGGGGGGIVARFGR